MDLDALLAAQDGLLHRRQALAAGLSRSALAHRVGPGERWRRVLPGVLATFTGALTPAQRWRAALLYAENGTDHAAGTLAMLGGPTACAAHGLQAARAGPVHLLLAERVRRRAVPPWVAVRRTSRLPIPGSRDGLPVAPVARAVVDAARELVVLREVRALVAESVQTRRTTVDRLARELGAGESAGSALVRRALEEVGWGTRSAPEAEVARGVRAAGLPEPRWNPSLVNQAGVWLADPDAWWRAANTVLEVDSYRWHLSPERADDTMARHERLTRHGLLVVHISPAQYRADPGGVLGRLAETLGYGVQLPPAPVLDAAEFRRPRPPPRSPA